MKKLIYLSFVFLQSMPIAIQAITPWEAFTQWLFADVDEKITLCKKINKKFDRIVKSEEHSYSEQIEFDVVKKQLCDAIFDLVKDKETFHPRYIDELVQNGILEMIRNRIERYTFNEIKSLEKNPPIKPQLLKKLDRTKTINELQQQLTREAQEQLAKDKNLYDFIQRLPKRVHFEVEKAAHVYDYSAPTIQPTPQQTSQPTIQQTENDQRVNRRQMVFDTCATIFNNAIDVQAQEIKNRDNLRDFRKRISTQVCEIVERENNFSFQRIAELTGIAMLDMLRTLTEQYAYRELEQYKSLDRISVIHGIQHTLTQEASSMVHNQQFGEFIKRLEKRVHFEVEKCAGKYGSPVPLAQTSPYRPPVPSAPPLEDDIVSIDGTMEYTPLTNEIWPIFVTKDEEQAFIKLLQKTNGALYRNVTEECCVCGESFDELPKIVVFPCGHRTYCASCLIKVLEKYNNTSCPICRAAFKQTMFPKSSLKSNYATYTHG